MGEVVSYRLEDGVAWLVIDRPEARNAINQAVGRGLWEGFRRFEEDPANAGPGGSGAEPGGSMVSSLPGVVRRVLVGVGEWVEAGDVLVLVEAMKTEHRVAAARPGRVLRVLVAEGQEVSAGTTVVELEGAADG